MRRSNRQRNVVDDREQRTLTALRTFRDHAVLMAEIYGCLRPMGKAVVKLIVIGCVWLAGLDALRDAVTLLMPR